MQDLIRRQLAQSIATMQSVHDSAEIHEKLLAAAHVTARAMQSGRTLYIAGNGGSAADAQHLAAEFVVRLTVNRPALRSIALTTDTSNITATGNDLGFDRIFARQLEALAQTGDVFLAITTSGKSPNILQALEQARSMGVHTLGLTGDITGEFVELCDTCIQVPSRTTMNVQESHLALEHIFCMLVERIVFGMDFDQPKIAPAS